MLGVQDAGVRRRAAPGAGVLRATDHAIRGTTDRRSRDAGAGAPRRCSTACRRRLHASILMASCSKWATLFPAERTLSARAARAPVRRAGARMPSACSRASRRSRPTPACARIGAGDPGEIPGRGAGAAAQEASAVSVARARSNSVFQPIDPVLERQLYPAGRAAPPGRAALWRAASPIQTRQAVEPLQGERLPHPADARGRRGRRRLPACAVRRRRRRRRRCSPASGGGRVRRRSTPGSSSRSAGRCDDAATGCRQCRRGRAHDRLELRAPARLSRRADARALRARCRRGVESPQAFAAYARSLTHRAGLRRAARTKPT